MQILGFILGYLFALIIFLIKRILKFILGIFKIRIFQETIQRPQFDVKRKTVDKTELFKKGEEFENFVRLNLFRKDNFTIVERTHNYDINKDDFVESTLKPDFKFRSLRTNVEFYVEAKWRQTLYNDNLKWSYPKQFERYQEYSKDFPLFIVIGLGGSPSHPDKLFLERIDQITDYIIPREDLDRLNFYSQREKYKIE